MLEDKDVLPICQKWAKRLARNATSLGPTLKERVDELIAVGYVAGKPLKNPKLLHSWVKWSMLHYIHRGSIENTRQLRTDMHYDKNESINLHAYLSRRRTKELQPIEECVDAENKNLLTKALAQLSKDDLKIVELKFWKGCTDEEIGKFFYNDKKGRGYTHDWANLKLKSIIAILKAKMK